MTEMKSRKKYDIHKHPNPSDEQTSMLSWYNIHVLLVHFSDVFFEFVLEAASRTSHLNCLFPIWPQGTNSLFVDKAFDVKKRKSVLILYWSELGMLFWSLKFGDFHWHDYSFLGHTHKPCSSLVAICEMKFGSFLNALLSSLHSLTLMFFLIYH